MKGVKMSTPGKPGVASPDVVPPWFLISGSKGGVVGRDGIDGAVEKPSPEPGDILRCLQRRIALGVGTVLVKRRRGVGEVLGARFGRHLHTAALAIADNVNRECRRDMRNVEARPGGVGEKDQVTNRQRFNIVGTALAMRQRVVAASITQPPLD